MNQNTRKRQTTYLVNEIFYSIQGEGSAVGMPMIFIRFAGCNLACAWCDTDHEHGSQMTGHQILEAIIRLAIGHSKPIAVCLTGGEPMCQVDRHLVKILCGLHWPLHIETNGTLWDDCLKEFETVTMSPKEINPLMEIDLCRNSSWSVKHCDLKLVYTDNPADMERLITTWGVQPFRIKFMQPMTTIHGTTMNGKEQYSMNTKEVIEWVLQNPDWRMSCQLHKIFQIR